MEQTSPVAHPAPKLNWLNLPFYRQRERLAASTQQMLPGSRKKETHQKLLGITLSLQQDEPECSADASSSRSSAQQLSAPSRRLTGKMLQAGKVNPVAVQSIAKMAGRQDSPSSQCPLTVVVADR